MKEKNTKFLTKQSGFTLIEIMVVVMIIGMLSAMIVPRFFDQQAKAMRNKAKSDISSISQNLGFYRMDNFTYPSTSEGLEALKTNPGKPNWSGPYSNIVPKDPWGNPFQYQFPGTNNPDSFDLVSFGADGVSGGEKFNADITNF